MPTFAIACYDRFYETNKISFIRASSSGDALKIFAKEHFDSEQVDKPGITFDDIQDMFYNSDMCISKPEQTGYF